jgi:hypothetical protein
MDVLTEGAPVSYTTNDGVVEPRWGHLIDYTYDGMRLRNGQLSGGLGQLVDGVKGPDSFSFNNGFEWVGWKSMNGDVVIEFTFKTLRNFTGALFHSNNLFSAGVEVFQAVDVHYGIDINLSMEALKDALHERERRQQQQQQPGATLSRPARQSAADEQATPAGLGPQPSTVWSADVLSIEYEPDKKAESSRPVTVHLKQRLANKLRFVLKFASKWILISEVEFLSHPVELMSLASLNEQLTPQLMADLRQAKTYDQYVAILREHQLRRIAADEYLNMGAALGSAAAATTPPSTASVSPSSPAGAMPTGASSEQPLAEQQDQQPAEPQARPDQTVVADSADDYRPPFMRRPLVWPGEQPPMAPNAGPATNPLFGVNQPPYLSPSGFLVDQQRQPAAAVPDKMVPVNGAAADQQQQRSRTIGLASVISFVFVGLLGLLGALFAISSYRLRCRTPKLGHSPVGIQRHLHQGVGSRASGGTGKSFLGSVFAAATSAGSSSSGGDSTNGSLHNTNNYQRQNQLTLAGHHNQLLFGNGQLVATSVGQQPQQQNQLLVSLKDSISSSGKCKSMGKSQAISTQLIVGLNQANPLAHQQIYNQQQPIYGQQTQQLHQNNQNNLYNSTTNSMSLTSSSTLNGNSHNQQALEYSLAASADYATPDLQPIIPTATNFSHHQLMGPPPAAAARQATFAHNDAFRSSARVTNHNSNRFGSGSAAGAGGQTEHNYEQINGELVPASGGAELRFNGLTANTIHHHHHQRTLSNQQQQHQQQQASSNLICGQQPFNSMTLSNGASFGGRPAARQAQQSAESSHYYYADTEAAKNCLNSK